MHRTSILYSVLQKAYVPCVISVQHALCLSLSGMSQAYIHAHTSIRSLYPMPDKVSKRVQSSLGMRLVVMAECYGRRRKHLTGYLTREICRLLAAGVYAVIFPDMLRDMFQLMLQRVVELLPRGRLGDEHHGEAAVIVGVRISLVIP